MNKRILFIILGALLLAVLTFVLWFWFFGRHNKAEVLPNNGSLGTATDSSNSGNTSGSGGNGQAPYGSNTNTSNNTGTQDSTNTEPQGTVFTYNFASTSFTSTPAGVTWLSNSFTLGSGGGGFDFDQSDINDVQDGTVTGSPYISKVTGADGQDISLLSSLAVVIGGCLISYAAQEAVVAPATTLISTGVSSAGNFLASLFGINLSGTTPLNPMYTSDITEQGKTSTQTVSECLTRTLGRLAVQAITDSTVDWINSGFDGQPAYVQDFGQFFDKVADQSAGEFIQSSDLAFLCSPFQLQVKIAIAQSYANRKSSSAGSCTLTGVTSNINSFLNGNFSDGGWPAFLELTTVPSNNPYAGFVQGQIMLGNKIVYDTNNAKESVSPGGFLSQTQKSNCKIRTTKDPDGTSRKEEYGCTYKIVTPGSVIEDSLHTAMDGQLDSLQLGESIDQILGALSNQLITKLLYNGLANVSPSDDFTDKKSTSKAQTLMETLGNSVSSAQQYAGIKQRTISDIQAAQQNLATLADCWSRVASSTTLSSDKVMQGSAGFTSAVANITSLQSQITQINDKITSANSTITKLQEFQTDLLLATVAKDVDTVQGSYNAIKNTDTPHLYDATDVTNAQQDRQSVQSQVATLNQSTATQLTQCHAI